MRRRTLLAAVPVLAAAPGAATADERRSSGDAALNISGVGLPVIDGGRVRNYVFVTVRLHIGAGRTIEQMRLKEAFFRDALVRAAHRTPFTVAGDWTRLNPAAISAAVMRAAPGVSGAGSVRSVEIVSQAPRRRTGVRAG
jgi:hypothetical protein